MPQNASTFLSVDLNALVHNYHFIKSYLKPNTNFLAVIKAFAYGHEAIAIAKALEKEKVAYFAVAYLQEGIHLRKAGISTPILVLHPQQSDVQDCVAHQLEPNIYSFNILETFQNCLKKLNIQEFPIHLKFNTGLNRLGFSHNDIPELLSKLASDNTCKIASVFSHLVASEDLDEKEFTQKQIRLYTNILSEIQKGIPYTFTKHLANTSGTLNYPEAHFDMVRIGIGLYGYANDKKWTAQLKNVGKLYAVISQIFPIQKGESVGYNRAFVAKNDCVSATIPIGHADGIPRTWSKGKGYVTIHGKKAPVLGNVCMDMIMVDVTNIACKEGDQVRIYDSQQTLEDLATKTGTISYELLTAISQRVPRIIVE